MPASQSDFRQGSADTDPWAVTSESAISVTNAVSNGYYYLTDSCANDDADGAVFTIPAEFPKGYNKFYLMKYELSQGMYRDFLNSLTRTQQANHIEAVIASGDTSVTNRFVMSNSTTVTVRNSIRAPASFTANVPITFGCDLNADGTFNGSTDGEWIAVNYLKWTDLAAFADWAGLRPFTEMEFEKAARGGQAVVMYEYAWGNTTYETATTSLSNTGAYNEVPNQGNSNQASCTPDGPYRVGSFSDAGATRQNAGAGYYGNLDLSGNLVENIVTVGVSASRSFDGTKQGDGSLSTNGYADVTTWPGLSSGEVTLESGYGDKGVSYGSSIAYQRTSQREYAACTMAARNAGVGLRVARNAP
jgi:formylglycine-generating enzyme required for sulfatase activity